MPTFSLTQSPQWLSISHEGKLSVDWSAAPTIGFDGAIVVMATQGSLTATKQITFKLKPRYRPILDYIETAQYSSRRKTIFRDLSIELEFTEHRSIASQTHRFTDAFLGGTGGGANQITANGVPIVANNIPVVNHP